MDGELRHGGLPRSQEDGGDDDVVVPRLLRFGEGVQRAVIAHFIELAKGAVKDPDPFQLIEGGKVQPQRLPAGDGSRHHIGRQHGKDLLRAVVLLCDLLLQLGVIVARLQKVACGEVGLVAVDHADGGLIVHGRIHVQLEGVLVHALGVFVSGVVDLVVDLQHHHVLSLTGGHAFQHVCGTLRTGRQGNFPNIPVLRIDQLKDPHAPQGHIILRQIQLIAVPRRPQEGQLIPDFGQLIHRADAVGIHAGQFAALIPPHFGEIHAVPLGIHRNAVGHHRHGALLRVVGALQGREQDAVLYVGAGLDRPGLGLYARFFPYGEAPRQENSHQHRHRHHDPRDGRRHATLPHTGKECGDPLPRRGRSYGYRLGQRGGQDHIVIQALQQLECGKPLDLLFLHTLYPLSCR